MKKFRFWEFLQSSDGRYSHKRIIAMIFAIVAPFVAFYTKSEPLTAIFVCGALGQGITSVFEKKTTETIKNE